MTTPTFSQTPAGGTVPRGYVPGNPPNDASGYPVYIAQELQKVSKAISALMELVPQAAAKAPARPIENMIRFAKAPWRPVAGQTTDRWVTYVGGSWVYLSTA